MTAPGPGSDNTTLVAAWNFDNSSVSSIADGTAFPSHQFHSFYGANVAVGDLRSEGGKSCNGAGIVPCTQASDCTIGQSCIYPPESILVGTGPNPASEPRVVGMEITGSGSGEIKLIEDSNGLTAIDFNPYGDKDYDGYPKYGVKVASVPPAERFRLHDGPPPPPDPLDQVILVARGLIQSAPESTYVCDFCCGEDGYPCDPESPPAAGEWNVWGDDTGSGSAQKQLALDEIDELYETLPDYESAGFVTDQIDYIEEILEDPQDGLLNEAAREEILGVLAWVRERYDPLAFPSVGVTAVVEDYDSPADVAISSAAATVYVRPGFTAGVVERLGTATLARMDDLDVPTGTGTVNRIHVPDGRQESYVVTRRPCSGALCTGKDYAVERVVQCDGCVAVDAGYINILTGAASGLKIRSMYTTPPTQPSKSSPAANTVWVALDDSGTGSVKRVTSLSDFDNSNVGTVGVSGRVYMALAPAPQGNERVYAAHSTGIDGLRTRTFGEPTSQNELVYPQGFGPPVAMASGTTADNAKRLFLISADELLAYEPSASCTTADPCDPVDDPVDLAGDAVGVTVSVDGRFVLVTRYPVDDEEGAPRVSVTTYDADSLSWVRETATSRCESDPCPQLLSPSPLALTSDASHAFSTDPENGRIAYMYLDPPRRRFTASYLTTVVVATKDEAFVNLASKAQMRNRAFTATTLFELGENAQNEEARKHLMRQAADRLYAIRADIDGCFGGNAEDDVMTDCYEATGIWNVTNQLLDAIADDLVAPPEQL